MIIAALRESATSYDFRRNWQARSFCEGLRGMMELHPDWKLGAVIVAKFNTETLIPGWTAETFNAFSVAILNNIINNHVDIRVGLIRTFYLFPFISKRVIYFCKLKEPLSRASTPFSSSLSLSALSPALCFCRSHASRCPSLSSPALCSCHSHAVPLLLSPTG